MEKLLKRIFTTSVVTSSILLLIGILLIVESEVTVLSIYYIIGATILSLGVLAIVRYFLALRGDKTGYGLSIVYGIITCFVGVGIINNPRSIAGIIPVIVGIGVLINSSLKLEYSMELKRRNNDIWKSTMVMACLSLLCGVLLIFNPFQGAKILAKIVGGFLVVYAILDIVGTLRIKKVIKEEFSDLKKIEPKVTEAEVVKEEKKKKNKK
ncbi:MAG: DUF308 domain-containing protein [Bacilli bacterium]|nr:DUF308 domain-containing protein [Bacilli bacterium]MBQ3468561.1 DUF308 domain-containing protein [Bacilli bacterium]